MRPSSGFFTFLGALILSLTVAGAWLAIAYAAGNALKP